MALVRISRSLHDTVENVINQFANKIYNEQIATLCPEAATNSVTDAEFAEYCESLLWGEHLHLKDQMPLKWCVQPENIDAHFKLDAINTRIRVTHPQRRIKVPPGTSSYSPDVSVPESEFGRVPWVRDFLVNRAAFETAKQEHTHKFNTIKQQVRAFLNGCKSLNDAVKKWPDIKLWLPDYTIAELERVVERTPRAIKEREEAELAVANMDTSLITSLGVMKAIHGA